MASINERTTRSGKKSYAVLYRHGSKQASKTLDNITDAKNFKSLVELLGPDKAIKEMWGTDVDQARLTVDDLFEKWIDWKATTKVTPRTVRDYRRDYDNWIRDHLGHRSADSIDEIDVQNWVDSMSKRGLDPKSVRDRHALFGGMYRFGKARSRRLVSHDPTTETQLPDKAKKAPKGFSLAEWEAMYAWASEHEPDAADLMLFFVSTGWRWGEAAPLAPAAIEDRGDLVVDVAGRQVVIPDIHVAVMGVNRVDENDRVVYVEGHAKSAASLRQINLPPAAARMVRRRLVGVGLHDPLFTNARGKPWHAQNFIQREFQRTLDAAGIEKVKGMGPHFFRHTHVAMLNRAKVAAGSMSRRIGHEDISTTFNVYGGGIDNALEPAELARLDALIASDTTVVAGEVVSGTVVRELD